MAVSVSLSNILPSVYNMIVITMMAAVGITLFKYLFAKWEVPGLSQMFAQL
jgi:hypothetical protein